MRHLLLQSSSAADVNGNQEGYMKKAYFLPVVLAAALAGGCQGKNRDQAAVSPAGSGAVGTSGETADVSGADRDFVRDASIANLAEIDLGRMALDRAADANVKKFAQMMVDDHTKANRELQTVASRHHIEIPSQVDDKHRDKAEDLSKKQGADFDRAFADAMVDGHQDVVDKLESRIDKKNASDWKAKNYDPATGKKLEAKGEAMTILPEKSDNPVTMSINEWAATTYPVAYAHLQAAKDLQKGVQRRSTNP
jgi:putative membrane protein